MRRPRSTTSRTEELSASSSRNPRRRAHSPRRSRTSNRRRRPRSSSSASCSSNRTPPPGATARRRIGGSEGGAPVRSANGGADALTKPQPGAFCGTYIGADYPQGRPHASERAFGEITPIVKAPRSPILERRLGVRMVVLSTSRFWSAVTARPARAAPIDAQRSAAAGTDSVLHDTYTLGKRIGEGGMADIFEATHLRLQGRFAIKLMRTELLTNPHAVRLFCREAEILSELRHPHIVAVFDFNTSPGGVPYFVMEHLDGIDLQTRLTQHPALSLASLVRIVGAVASALGAAHALGVVHHDLKPANIFLVRGERGDDDFVKLIDFGISRTTGRLSDVSTPAGPAGIMGTPAFMAPEHALGLATQIDPRSDQFALGAITYLILTGREPFVGSDPASVLHEVVHAQPPRLSHFLRADFSQIQAVLDRALSKQPRDRFDTIAAFALALASAAAPLIRADAAPPAARNHVLRSPPGVHSVVPWEEDEAPPPIRRSAGRPFVG